MMPILVLFLLLAPALPAATGGCEVPSEVRQALDSLDRRGYEMKYAERMAYTRKTLEELLARYPREIAVHRKYAEFIKRGTPDAFPALRQKYQQEAERNPQDAFAVYMAGYALQDYKTPESLRLVEKAKTLDPAMPWTYITLASLYGGGKFADKAKTSENMAGYFRVCPASLEELPLQMLGRRLAPDAQHEIARDVRARLEKELDPERLKRYADVWGIEFRTRPVPEHPALRKQVASDVKRLKGLNAKPDAAWLDFLKNGMKQAGASKDALKAMDERILRESPTSPEAQRIVTRQWRTDHPEPKPDASVEEWTNYQKSYLSAVEGWMRQFPRDETSWLQTKFWIQSSMAPDSRKAAVETGVQLLKAAEQAYGPAAVYVKTPVVNFFLRQDVKAKRALSLLEEYAAWRKQERAWRMENDRLTEKEIAEMRKYELAEKQYLHSGLLHAYLQLKKVAEARKLRCDLEGPAPKDRSEAAQHWENLALFAQIEGRKADALAFYQRALHTRPKAPGKRYGLVEDPLLDEARALWGSTGGTDAAWELWSKLPAAAGQELAQGRWERPEKDLPPFELTDLNGKKWNSKDLLGKALFINVWATWCGPCNAELPHLQKIYETMKGRNDVVLLSLNVDDELGLVEPFVKDKALSFPVLPAVSFVRGVLDSISIPRNWIVDAKGKWRWEQLGFDNSETNWESTVLAKIESVK
jgi:thiol-disulfide isomerase/thioredoxin